MRTSTICIRFSLWLGVVILLVLCTPQLDAADQFLRRVEDLTDEQRLLQKLRTNYDPAVRPVYDAKEPVIINLGITLTQIIDVDEKNQVLTTNVWLDQEWTDQKLNWNVTDYANITMLRIPCDLIWLPDIVLYNSVENHNKGYMKSLAMVSHEGRIFWPPIVRMRSSCKMDITYFPFDDQICILKLGSWAYDGLQVDVTNRTETIDLTNYVDNGEWELIGNKIVRNVKFYPCCPEPFPDIVFFLHIRRRVLYYLLNVIIPCMLLSSLSLTGFLLPPDSGEKVTLGLTVLLAFSVFMLLVAENMPPTSEYIPLIGIYLTVIMAMSALSVALSVFVLNCHHRGAMLHRPPRLVRILARTAARAMCMHLRYLGRAGSSYPSCRGFSPSSFMSSCPSSRHSHRHPACSCSCSTSDNGLHEMGGDSSSSSTTSARIEREILHYLRAVLEAHEKSRKEQVAVNEWQEVARVLDKFFFWVFVAVTAISTLVLLVFSPMTKNVTFPES
ncbi:neuronal acetylcholine receptor subunit alpha-10-like [Babylonia areolata]|uniref:neuronal acetylcholine receptor subunit alpha-10-like n=1 Tax=Babylonia areolata TaxID=304850 RepID=UPI003FD51A09